MMRDNGYALVAASTCVTTLVWPSEAIPKTVLDTLTGPGGPFELREEAGARRARCSCSPTGRSRSSSCCTARPSDMGDQPYVIFPDREYTFASILQPIAAVAAALRDQYGVGPGDRVAIVAPNTVEYALVFWATTALGGDHGRAQRLVDGRGDRVRGRAHRTEGAVRRPASARTARRRRAPRRPSGAVEFERRLRRARGVRARRAVPRGRPSTRTTRSSSSSPAARPGAPRA